MAGRAAVTSARHKLDGVAARRVLAAVTQLSNDPRPHGLRALVGEPSGVFRLRVGDYRVVYHVEDARRRTLTTGEVASPLAGTPYDLRHAAVSTWLNAGRPRDPGRRVGRALRRGPAARLREVPRRPGPSFPRPHRHHPEPWGRLLIVPTYSPQTAVDDHSRPGTAGQPRATKRSKKEDLK